MNLHVSWGYNTLICTCNVCCCLKGNSKNKVSYEHKCVLYPFNSLQNAYIFISIIAFGFYTVYMKLHIINLLHAYLYLAVCILQLPPLPHLKNRRYINNVKHCLSIHLTVWLQTQSSRVTCIQCSIPQTGPKTYMSICNQQMWCFFFIFSYMKMHLHIEDSSPALELLKYKNANSY